MNNVDMEQLRAIWRDTRENVPAWSRQEALWEYWRRIAGGEAVLNVEELLEAVDLRVPGVENVVLELARKGRLNRDLCDSISRRLSISDASLRELVGNTLAAAAALVRLADGVSGPERERTIEAVAKRGMYWAARAALPALTRQERDLLVSEAKEAGVYTRGQLHELRLEVARLSRKPGGRA